MKVKRKSDNRTANTQQMRPESSYVVQMSMALRSASFTAELVGI